MSRRAIPVCGASATRVFAHWIGQHMARKYAPYKAAANDGCVRALHEELERLERRRWRQIQQEAGK